MASNLPAELLERINRPSGSRFSAGKFETSSGGFMPFTSMTRRSQSLGATSLNASVAHVSETSHWLTRNQVSYTRSRHVRRVDFSGGCNPSKMCLGGCHVGGIFLAASTECSAGSNDHFVVVVLLLPRLVQFDGRPLGGANFQY
jgi:hypothetical protein